MSSSDSSIPLFYAHLFTENPSPHHNHHLISAHRFIHPSFCCFHIGYFFPVCFQPFFSTLTAKYAFYLYTCIHYFSDNHQVINTAMLGPIPKLRSNLVRIEYSRGVYLKCVNGGFDCFERGFLFGFSVLHVVLKQDEKYTHRSTLERINNNKVLHNNHRITS